MAVELISVHVAKTAGSSFIETLKQVYGQGKMVLDYEDKIADPASQYNMDPARRELFRQRSVKAVPPSTRVIHGHFHAAKYTDAFPSAKRIVWLRNPVARLVSNYYFWMTDKSPENIVHSLHRYVVAEKLTLMEFARLPYFRNIMARKYFEGLDLSYFHFVGIYENFKEDLEYLGEMLNWPRVEMARKNKTIYAGYDTAKEETLSDQRIVKEIEDLNSEDMELYRQAVKMREERIKAGA